jgi:DNA-binding SARP family transcriptional activator
MNIALISQTQTSADTEVLSVPSLMERAIEYFEQEHYTEGMTLLTLVREHLTPGQMHLAPLLDVLRQECAKHSHLQQALQEVSTRFIEIHAELQASIATLSSLRSTLLIETNSEQAYEKPEYAHRSFKQASIEDDVAHPTLYVICLGPFEVRRLGVALALCSNRNGQAILRYLVAQSDRSATVDTLMALFWPEDPPEVALRKLQVTVSILRRSLQSEDGLRGGYILCKQGVYQLNSSLQWHSDVEEFLTLYNAGRKANGNAAVTYYERACALYTRPFLMEDLYADWSFPRREQLRQMRRDMCSALATHYVETRSYEQASRWGAAIIEENRCDEAAYQQLMRIYALGGRRNDALQVYQRCQQVLLQELGMQPMPETVALYHAIISGELHQ